MLSLRPSHLAERFGSAFTSPFESQFYTQAAPRLIWRAPQSYLPKMKWWLASLLFALVFVLPFYAQWLCEGLSLEMPKWLMSLLGILSIASLLFTPKNRRLSVGFFVGVLWFYWIGLGLRYFDMSALIPLVVVLEGGLIALVFYVGLWCECFVWRFAFLMLLSFFTPLGFDWIVPESVFAYSYVGVDKLSFAFVIIALWSGLHLVRFFKFFALLPLLLALDSATFHTPPPAPLPLKIKLIQSAVSQDIAYRMRNLDSIFRHYVFEDIARAIEEGYDVVVLPESAFYVPLDSPYFAYFDELMEMSERIVIIAGALRAEVDSSGRASYFNSTYKFDRGQVEHIDKVLLVPFGERLPSFLLPVVERVFQGVGGFSAGEGFKYFEIKGARFKNAVCYEGSNREFYADSPRYVLMTSNNAWFVPSLEPILQKNLMKYYARLYGSTILHATNLSPSGVISP